jgi:pilus assembly protein TadC
VRLLVYSLLASFVAFSWWLAIWHFSIFLAVSAALVPLTFATLRIQEWRRLKKQREDFPRAKAVN